MFNNLHNLSVFINIDSLIWTVSVAFNIYETSQVDELHLHLSFLFGCIFIVENGLLYFI